MSKSPSNIKGTGFRGYRNYLEKHLGLEARETILALLRPEVRALLSGNSLLINAWYPVEFQHHFLKVFTEVLAADAEASCRSMGQELARTDLRGVYRVFIWVASVQQTLTVLTKVWNSYFSTGTARFSAQEGRRGIAQITDPYQHRYLSPIVAGYLEVAIGLAGGKNARVEYAPRVGDTVEFTCAWA